VSPLSHQTRGGDAHFDLRMVTHPRSTVNININSLRKVVGVDQWYAGQTLTIWLRPGCLDSWDAAEAGVPGNQRACLEQFRARLKRLADHGKLRNPDYMNAEGDGISAVKATCGLRAYGWLCHVDGRRAFVVSHVVLKRENRADPRDIARAAADRVAFEAEQERKKQARR